VTDAAAQYARRPALVVLAVTIVLGAVVWALLGRAAKAGIARLERLDRMHAHCDSAWAAARTREDTMRVNRLPLPDTIDANSRSPLAQCGDLGDQRARRDERPAPPRELSGEPMPRGLR
jgi:hypothetical protein